MVDQTIHVVDATVVNITGIVTSAGLDGGFETPLLVVINASVYESDVTFSFGSAIVGGTIAASASSVTLSRMAFIGNKTAGNGGALFVSDGSSFSL